jgi:hypothetical protein
MNDTSVFNTHMDNSRISGLFHANPAASATGLNYMHHQFNPLLVPAALKRVSADDSMTHLLVLNTSATASYMEPGALVYELNQGKGVMMRPQQKQQQQQSFSSKRGGSSSNGEVYDDISLKEMHNDDEEEQCRHRKEQQQHTHQPVKLNEYCYIHANGLVIGNIEASNKVTATNPSVTPIKVTTENEAKPRTSSEVAHENLNSPNSMKSSVVSPSAFQHNSLSHVTSTPSLPKTLPPTFNKLECVEIDTASAVVASGCYSNETNQDDYHTCSETIRQQTLVQQHEVSTKVEEPPPVLLLPPKVVVNTGMDTESTMYLQLNPYPESIRDDDDEYQVPTNYPRHG